MNLASTLLGLLATAPAFADEPTTFSLDPVFVSRFEATAELTTPAEGVRRLIEDAANQRHLVIPIQDVPRFESYSAEMYLRACPPGQILGCAFVVGGKAGVDWVITGEVTPATTPPQYDAEPEDTEVAGPPLDVTVFLIDVADSRVALSFSVTVDGRNDEAFANGVVDVLDRVIAGGAALQDLRGEIEDPKAARERKKAEAEIAAQALSELEEELGAMLRDNPGRLEEIKLTTADLDRYREREGAKPWDQLAMTEAEYLRFKNSGKSIVEWRELSQGVFKQILIRIGGGVGTGPFTTHFDGRWARDDTDLSIIEQESWQEVRQGRSMYAELEVGFGILPFLDVGLTLGSRNSDYTYAFANQVQGQEPDVEDPEKAIIQTFQVGGRVTFAPMPTYFARPTITAGLEYWAGKQLGGVVDLDFVPHAIELKGPTVVVGQISPGGEINLSRSLTFFLRFQLQVPLIGNRVERDQVGQAILTERFEPSGTWGLGLEGVAGLMIRIRPFGKVREKRTIDDDEP